ncbi:amidohydrolase family protein [Myceligenerans pegani]|uniref:Amidohydrolase family protein n=1 Tax=Myceligenerans pegani TaxID=2776917 RepID=A0ABR9N2Q5_9MICO|nr:amidohydrolase family protein [Myceligenerans sp. TRM 65318]MBE1877434.1 amidohydrolase family protein [Myceligenerans sp. TRM 65318]MBE3019705.1 amidohydrolase family protein [Myceligenerans sp. TRM 65318]
MSGPVLDAHVHVWDPARLSYPWLAGAAGLDRRFVPADVDTADGAIREWVFVEADADLAAAADEVAWVSSLDWPGLRAIVAHADLRLRDLGARLRELTRFPLVRGVRQSLQDAPESALTAPEFADGLREVGTQGLTFDACVRWQRLDRLADVVAGVPGTRIVVDHLGKPPVAAGLASPDGARWRAAIDRLAELPHVWVKLSGLAPEAPSAEVLRASGPAFVRYALDAFGPGRSMFGGDWPVSGLPGAGVPVATSLELVRTTVGETAWADVSGGTARRCYGIDPVTSASA